MTWPIAILLAAWSVLPLPRQNLPDTKPISSAALLRHVAFLADDELAGRGICTPGLDTAAAYIADAFRSAGLEPAGSSGSYFHSFEATVGVTLTGENHLIVKRGGETLPLELDEDFIPFGFSESGAFHDIEVVFAGYGITDPEQGYDDYAGLDVTGKAVLVLRHEPPRGKDAGWSHHALFRTKAQNARAHGAAAILIVNDPRSHPEGEEEDELVALRQGGRIGITALHLRERAGAHLLGDLDLAALQKEIDETRKPASRPLPDLRIDLAVSLERRKCTTKNVVGLLPGNSDEYVVIGAHYDHLGMGGTSSLAADEKPAIHNGADDNASGVAGMLELARVFAAEGTPPQKNLLFIAFTGEESGLLGSAAFVRETKIPLDRITAMINLDMIGRMRDNRLTIFGVETATAFREIVERTTPGLTVTTHGDGYGPSDQTSFYVKKIPVLFYFTGAHRDYHKPSDDVEKINVAGMARVTHAVYLAVREILTLPHPLHFVQVEPETPPQEGDRAGGYGAYFGVIPDFGESEGGVLISGVRTGSPAEKAGVKGGDKILHFGDMAISDLYDLTDALRKYKPGDTVEVVLLRNGTELRVSATLAKRSRRRSRSSTHGGAKSPAPHGENPSSSPHHP